MDKRKIRDTLRLLSALLFCWLYIPHLLAFYCIGKEGTSNIRSDVKRMAEKIHVSLPTLLYLLYFLHNNRYYRCLFYYRIGPVWDLLISWYRPGDRYFTISKTMKMGPSCLIAHPYSTVLNADSIGEFFSCIHCTTIGATAKGRPTIGHHVTIGANVSIVGNVHIGNNVTIGAGSVVVKDIPDNCIAAGNPAKVIKTL